MEEKLIYCGSEEEMEKEGEKEKERLKVLNPDEALGIWLKTANGEKRCEEKRNEIIIVSIDEEEEKEEKEAMREVQEQETAEKDSETSQTREKGGGGVITEMLNIAEELERWNKKSHRLLRLLRHQVPQYEETTALKLIEEGNCVRLDHLKAMDAELSKATFEGLCWKHKRRADETK